MRIPVPLNALRAFEAAARHLSIKDAALELAVTPSAVSHQLRTLEDMLGVELLRRIGTRLELTSAGRRLAPSCWRRLNLDSVCRFNFDRGLVASI